MGYIFQKPHTINVLEGQSEFLRCSLPTPYLHTPVPVTSLTGTVDGLPRRVFLRSHAVTCARVPEGTGTG